MQLNINEITPKEIIAGYHGRFIHTGRLTIAYWEVAEGATMPVHQHIHEQTSQVTTGKFELTVNGIRTLLEPGMVIVIPPNVPHGGIAITPCQLLDIFAPVREDYQ